MLPIYYSLSTFTKNSKTEFYNSYSQELNYYNYLIQYKNIYTDYIANLPIQKIILAEGTLDYLCANKYEEYLDTYSIDLFNVLKYDGLIAFEKYLEDVFNDDFLNMAFQFYNIKTATSLISAFRNNDYKQFQKLIDNEEGKIEHSDIAKLNEDDDDFYEKYEDIEEKEDKKRCLWLEKLDLKVILIDLVEKKYIPEFQNIVSKIDTELELELERKKSTNSENKVVAEQITEKESDKIRLLHETGIINFLTEKYPNSNPNQIAKFFELLSEQRMIAKNNNALFTTDKTNVKYPMNNLPFTKKNKIKNLMNEFGFINE